MDIGILVHGRHVQAIGWEQLVWGEPPEKLGSVPAMVYEVLEALLAGEDVRAVVFGTGASEKDGLKESEYTKRFLVAHLSELGQFRMIREHPCFRAPSDQARLGEILRAVICETKSQNTLQEVENAAAIFAAQDVTRVLQIACGSHLPRCIVNQLQVREAGKIPQKQRWYGVADDMTFGGVPIGKSVVILEAPHRGDDPMVHVAMKPHEVIPGLFGLTVPERVFALSLLKSIIEGVKALKGA